MCVKNTVQYNYRWLGEHSHTVKACNWCLWYDRHRLQIKAMMMCLCRGNALACTGYAAVIKSFRWEMVNHTYTLAPVTGRSVTAHWADRSLWQWAFKSSVSPLEHDQHELLQQNVGKLICRHRSKPQHFSLPVTSPRCGDHSSWTWRHWGFYAGQWCEALLNNLLLFFCSYLNKEKNYFE